MAERGPGHVRGTARSRGSRGMALMALAMLTMPGIDAIAKYLADSISSAQVTWGRFFFQSVLMLPVVLWTSGPNGLVPNDIPGNVARGLLLALASLFFFTAVRFMPIADALAIFFVEPMILTVLSVIFLGETVGWRRRVAVVVGFFGALAVIQPSFATVGPASLLPLGTAFCFAVYLLITRHVTRRDDAVTMQFSAGVAGLLFLTGMLATGHLLDVGDIAPKAGDRRTWALLILAGVIATVGHLMIVEAFKREQASALAGFQYLEIVSGTALGLWLFGDFPNTTTWFGVVIIIGSGIYIYWREGRAADGQVAVNRTSATPCRAPGETGNGRRG